MPLEIHRWWIERPDEPYWLEVTDRKDPGANLKAPQRNESGNEFWSYSILKEVQGGDRIFHYDRQSQAIIAMSRATGDFWEDQVVWAARGTSARDAGVEPHLRSGWYVGLQDFASLLEPLDLEGIRAKTEKIQARYHSLLHRLDGPLYFPFELGEKRPIRPLQGYLFKLPRFFVELFDELPSDSNGGGLMNTMLVRDRVGSKYRPADEEASVGGYDPMEVDPAIVERGTRGHAVTQNALAEYIQEMGHTPRSPLPTEPNYDLAWEVNDTTYVAEVKSVTNKNEERQLRMGLGQVLKYRHDLQVSGLSKVEAVLVSERKPPADWIAMCRSLSVYLVWPGQFERLHLG